MKFNLKVIAATAAVAMMGTGVAHAQATIAVSPAGTYTYSQEGLALKGAAPEVLPNIVVTFGNNLTYQDDIYITLSGGVISIAPTVVPTLVVCTTAGPTPPSLGYVSTVSGGWSFRVTSVAGISFGDSCTFSGLAVQAASLANNVGGTLNYQANRFVTGQLVDNASNSSSVVVKSQFDWTVVTPLNGEIDVYQNRYAFTLAESIPNGTTNEDDTLVFTSYVNGGGIGLAQFTGPTVTATSQILTISGDFSWVDTDGDGCELTEFGARLLTFVDYAAVTGSDCTKVVLNGTAANTSEAGYFNVPGNPMILSPTDYTASMAWTYSYGAATGSKSDSSQDPGAWGINGAQVYIQYMPYGTGVSRIVYVANSGVIEADAVADIFYAGGKFSCDFGAIPSKTVTQLSSVLDACVAAEGITSGKIAILVTFTAPDVDIEMYSAYNVGGNDRGTVVNTSNGRGLTYFSKVD